VEAVVRPVLHQVDEFELRFTLYADGAFTVTNTDTGIEKPAPWYKDERGKPWKVRKRKSFKGLVRTAFKDGDYADYRSNTVVHGTEKMQPIQPQGRQNDYPT
jgi:hypothetical protein